MSLSNEDIGKHHQILDHLHDVLTIINVDRDLIVSYSHRLNELPWTEAFTVNFHRIAQLRTKIGEMTEPEIEALVDHGLMGVELELKRSIIDRLFRRFNNWYENNKAKIRSKKGTLSGIRKALGWVLKPLNAYLESLASVIPLAGGVKEFKDILEASFAISERISKSDKEKERPDGVSW